MIATNSYKVGPGNRPDDVSWRNYGNNSQPLNESAGLVVLTIKIDQSGKHGVEILVNTEQKDYDHVVNNVAALMEKKGMAITGENHGNSVLFTADNTGPDGLIKVAEALSGDAVGEFQPMLSKASAKKIIRDERTAIANALIEETTGKAPALSGRDDYT